jgi:hypothetical protein
MSLRGTRSVLRSSTTAFSPLLSWAKVIATLI